MDDITALVKGKNKEVTEMAKKVMLKEEVEKKGLKSNCQSLEKWRGRNEQDDCVVWFLGERVASLQ